MGSPALMPFVRPPGMVRVYYRTYATKDSAIALGEIGDAKAIPALEKARLDTDPDVRKLAQLALVTIAGKAA